MYNCPAYTAASNEYWNSDSYVSLLNANSAFYASLIPGVLDGIFPLASVGYYDAFEIWDYVQYCVYWQTTQFSHRTVILLQQRQLREGLWQPE
jgi:hypothetical protein